MKARLISMLSRIYHGVLAAPPRYLYIALGVVAVLLVGELLFFWWIYSRYPKVESDPCHIYPTQEAQEAVLCRVNQPTPPVLAGSAAVEQGVAGY